jgi:DNA (cytosine-5)-methyltransferase 1
MTDYLKVVDLFSGPGGLSRGFEDARNSNYQFKTIVANDINEHAGDTYKANHKGTEFILGSIADEGTKKKIISAVKKKTGKSTVDLVIGGPPCKGFSLANKMTRDMDNPMNHLMFHFFEMVKRLNPAAFVMENVPGIVAMENGKVVELLINKFKKLGYKNADYMFLNAADYGAPQLRKRAFIVGSKSEIPIEDPAKTHGSNEDLKKDSSLLPYVTLIDAIDDLPTIRTGSITSRNDDYLPKSNPFQAEMRKKSDKVKDHVITKNTPLVIERIKTVPPGGNWEDIPRKLMQVDGKYSGIENAHSMIYKRLLKKEPAITITNFRKGMIIHPTQNRLFSVREAARIQTFPDDYIFKGGLSAKQQQVADAVPVMLARKVSESILKHLHQVIKVPHTR